MTAFGKLSKLEFVPGHYECPLEVCGNVESVVAPCTSPPPWSLCPASWCLWSSSEEPSPWCCASPMFLLALFAKLFSFCMFKYQSKCLLAQMGCLPHGSKAPSVPSGLMVKQQCLAVAGREWCLHRDRLTAPWALAVFPFPKARSKASPRAGWHLSSGYSNANRSLLRREEGSFQKSKKIHFKMKTSNNLPARTFGKNKHFFLPELLISTGSNALEASLLHCLKEIIQQENFGKVRHCLKQNIFSR